MQSCVLGAVRLSPASAATKGADYAPELEIPHEGLPRCGGKVCVTETLPPPHGTRDGAESPSTHGGSMQRPRLPHGYCRLKGTPVALRGPR